jgi:hypothetical protein
LGPRVLVFVNGFRGSSSLCRVNMSALAVELGCLDDFLGPRVLVFINGFCASTSLCTMKISA